MREHRNSVIQLLILGVLGAAVVLTLVAPELGRTAGTRELVEVSVLIRNADNSLWANARLGMEQAAEDFGAELRFLTPSRDNDPLEQEEMLCREVERGTDALVLVPVDMRSVPQCLEKLTDTIPVVTLESDVAGTRGIVGPNSRELGEALAHQVLEDYEGDQVLLLDGALPNGGLQARAQAVERTLRRGGVEVLLQSQSSQSLSQLLTRKKNLSAVVALDSAATEQAAKEKENCGSTASLYGVGATGRITSWLDHGIVDAVAAWSDYAAGYLAVEGAIQAYRGDYGSQSESLPFSVVKGEEIYDSEYQKLLFPVTS